MRFIFKTTYRQDLRLFRDHFQRNWYLALVAGLLVLPILLPDYLVDFSLVLIFGLCALSLMVLAGYTGLVSLGHAAFLGIGAYAHVYLSQDLGLPWIVSVALAAGIAAAAGVLVGLPALRMTGIYLTIATLAFALIIQEVFNHWDSVTGGLRGKVVEKPVIFGVPLRGDAEFYFLCLAFLAAGLWITRNVLRAPTGRAWVAIRDSEIAVGGQMATIPMIPIGSITTLNRSILAARGRHLRHSVDDLAVGIFGPGEKPPESLVGFGPNAGVVPVPGQLPAGLRAPWNDADPLGGA